MRLSRVEPNGTVTAQLPIGRNVAYAVLPDGIVGGAAEPMTGSRFPGVLVGRVEFPAGFEVHEIGPDDVLGVTGTLRSLRT